MSDFTNTDFQPPRKPTRRAQVTQTLSESQYKNPEVIQTVLEDIRVYLPKNYKVGYNSSTKQFLITGHDNAGWTLDDYVIPRLASGLIFAEEI